jgi:hypothetical protein
VLAEAKQRLGFVPDGSADAELIVGSVHAEIGALCRAAGARMLVVLLGRAPSPQRLLELQRHASVVDAELALCRAVDAECRAPQISEAYLRAYGHFRGSPPVFVDSHPNPRAHAVIAAEITAAIRSR